MSGQWGKHLQLSIFGESHGPAIGITIHGLPSGLRLDWAHIDRQMQKRRPGTNAWSTSRAETDRVEIISGYFAGKTTGTPLTALIYNKDQDSKDYRAMADVIRPSHADYPGQIRYKGHNDYRGGGHFSGRLTAPLVFAGGVAQQILRQDGVEIKAFVTQIGTHLAQKPQVSDLTVEALLARTCDSFPTYQEDDWAGLKEVIKEAKDSLDSVGGQIQCLGLGLKAGWGNPFFYSLESVLSSLIFSIPAVKGLSFGKGFDLASLKGSEANDTYQMVDGCVRTRTNHNGGILGGITTGMPLDFTVALKPTPSIGKAQETVDLSSGENILHQTKGRHDPCIVVRAIPVIEAVTAIALLENKWGQAWT